MLMAGRYHMHFLEEGKWSDCMNEVGENNDCLFCKIVEKKIPADIVYESEDLIAFKGILISVIKGCNYCSCIIYHSSIISI